MGLDCFALLQDEDLQDLLGSDEKAKAAFRKKYKTKAPPPVETARRRSGGVADRRAARESCPAAGRAPRRGAARDDSVAGAATARPPATARPARRAPRQRGTVLWFEAAKKHGFIQSEGRDIFVHLSDVKEPLGEGDIVEFSVLTFKGRPKAQDVVKISGPPPAKVERVRGTCLWYDATRKMGFLKGEDGQEIFCHASDVKDSIGEGDLVEYASVSFQRQERRPSTSLAWNGRRRRAAAAAADHRQHVDPSQRLEDEEPARVFLSIVSDVAGAGWIEDQQLGAALTGKGVRLALIHAMRAGALKRRWVEYGRRRLDNNAVLSTFDYVAWPEHCSVSIPGAGHVPARDEPTGCARSGASLPTTTPRRPPHVAAESAGTSAVLERPSLYIPTADAPLYRPSASGDRLSLARPGLPSYDRDPCVTTAAI